jgi:hypothetical protein
MVTPEPMTRKGCEMDASVFEARLMELMFKSDARIIPQLVAYRVGCSVELARRYLDEMVTSNILTMEVDDKGVIDYEMPGRPAATNEPLSWATEMLAARSPAAEVTQTSAHPISYQQIAHANPLGPIPIQVQINNVPQPTPMRVMVVGQTKSAGLAVMLALLFGPLGMIYATGAGAAVMFLVNLLVIGATAGVGLVITLPVGAIWAASAVSQHNAKLASGVVAYAA